MELIIIDASGERNCKLDDRETVTLGRSKKNTVVLKANGCSRTHCYIWYENGRFLIKDLESKNGTLVNEKKVSECELKTGDEIKIGDARLIFASSCEPKPSPLSLDKEITEPKQEILSLPSQPEEKSVELTYTKKNDNNIYYRKRPSLISIISLLFKVVCAGVIVILFFKLTGFSKDWEFTAQPSHDKKEQPGKGGDNLNKNNKTEPTGLSATEKSNTETQQTEIGDLDKTGEQMWSLICNEVKDTDELIKIYREFIDQYPATKAAAEASRRLEFLINWSENGESDGFGIIKREVSLLPKTREFSKVAYLASFFEERASSAKQAKNFKDLLQEIEKLALVDYTEITQRSKELIEQGRLMDANLLYVQNIPKWQGFNFFPDAIEDLKRLEETIADKSKSSDTPPKTESKYWGEEKAIAIRENITELISHYKFEEASLLLDELVKNLDPSLPRKDYELLAQDVKDRSRLFELLVSNAGKAPIKFLIGDGFDCAIISADKAHFTVEIDIKGSEEKPKLSESWTHISPLQFIQLCDQLPLDGEDSILLAGFCWDTGYKDKTFATLARLSETTPSFKSKIDVFLSSKLNVPVPEGGFVLFEGKYITQTDADKITKDREEQNELTKKTILTIKKSKQDKLSGIEAYYNRALTLQKHGYFEAAKELFTALAMTYPNTDIGVKAKDKADDPFLRVEPIVTTGPSSNRLDIYIMGDGYTIKDKDQSTFDKMASRAARDFLMSDPFKEYKNYFNFHKLNIASKEAGCSISPGNTKKDTALGGTINYGIITVNHGLVHKFLARVDNSDEQAIVFINRGSGPSTGGGGIIATNPDSTVLGHEFGHSFTGLGDEYTQRIGKEATGPSSESKQHRYGFEKIDGKWIRVKDIPSRVIAPNLIEGSNKQEMLKICPWKYWIDKQSNWRTHGMDEVGLFEGGGHKTHDVWRPQMSCKMRTANSEFCVVCMEVMVKKLYEYVKPIDDYEPKIEEITCTPDEPVILKIYPMLPQTHRLKVEWSLKSYTAPVQKDDPYATVSVDTSPGKKMTSRWAHDRKGRGIDYIYFKGKDLGIGKYAITAKVSDPTPWVLKDDNNLLKQEHSWIVNVVLNKTESKE